MNKNNFVVLGFATLFTLSTVGCSRNEQPAQRPQPNMYYSQQQDENQVQPGQQPQQYAQPSTGVSGSSVATVAAAAALAGAAGYFAGKNANVQQPNTVYRQAPVVSQQYTQRDNAKTVIATPQTSKPAFASAPTTSNNNRVFVPQAASRSATVTAPRMSSSSSSFGSSSKSFGRSFGRR